MYNMIEYNTTYAILYIMYYMLYYYLSKNVRNPESMFMLPIQMCPHRVWSSLYRISLYPVSQ